MLCDGISHGWHDGATMAQYDVLLLKNNNTMSSSSITTTQQQYYSIMINLLTPRTTRCIP